MARTRQTNVQLEQAFGRDFTGSVGFIYANGDNLPVVTDVNLDQPDSAAGRRPSGLQHRVSARRRVDPRFNRIFEVQSIGESTFKGLTLQASKRLAQGLTFNVQYVTGKGIDNTPLLTQLTVQAEQGRSDPSNLDRDKGPNPLDMRHNFSGNIVYTSSSSASNAVVRALLDGNQIGVLLQFNSSLPFNIRVEPRSERRRRRQRSAAVCRPQLDLPAAPLQRRHALHAHGFRSADRCAPRSSPR